VIVSRHISWKTVAAGAAILGGIGALVRAIHKDAPVSPKRVALIGDSYAVGLGPELAKIFPEFRAEGVEGTNSSQWANHSAKCGTCGDWLTTFKPDVVLVSLGTNDNPPNATNYQTLVRALHGIGARVVWIRPPAGVNAPEARAIIASLGVQEVPSTTVTLTGIHPSGTGYHQWAQEIAEVIRA
jgi:lysophospholipase L1-like esterase